MMPVFVFVYLSVCLSIPVPVRSGNEKKRISIQCLFSISLLPFSQEFLCQLLLESAGQSFPL